MIDFERLATGWTTDGLPGKGEPIEHHFIVGWIAERDLRDPPRRAPRRAADPAADRARARATTASCASGGSSRRSTAPTCPHTAAIAVCTDTRRARPHLLPDGLRRRLVADGTDRRLAGAVRHRPRGAAGPRVPARRGHRAALEGRLAGEGPAGPRPARRLPRTPGRPVDRVPRAHQGPRAARLRRRRRRGSARTGRSTTSRASCTATTSSPT